MAEEAGHFERWLLLLGAHAADEAASRKVWFGSPIFLPVLPCWLDTRRKFESLSKRNFKRDLGLYDVRRFQTFIFIPNFMPRLLLTPCYGYGTEKNTRCVCSLQRALFN